jgi:hypothetical protein
MGAMGKAFKPVLGCVFFALVACQPAAEEVAPEPLETEEVGPAVDAAVTTEYDIQAKSSIEIVGARMPSDFPPDVPLYGASSVINYGPAAADRHFVELSIPAQPSTVEPRYNAQLEAAGWRRGSGGEFVRQGRRIVVTYRQGTPGTWVRIEYPT